MANAEDTDGTFQQVVTGSQRQSVIHSCSTCTRTAVRMTEAVYKPQRVLTMDTVCSRLVGIGSKAEHRIFRLAVKSTVIWIMWVVGACCGLSTLTTVSMVPDYFVWASFLMLPLPCVASMSLSMALVTELLWQFEVYFLVGMSGTLLFCNGRLLQDKRMVFWICTFPSMIFSTLIDAYPSKYRSKFTLLFSGGLMAIYLLWVALLMFDEHVAIHSTAWVFFRLKGDTAQSSIQCCITLLCFCGRHLFVAIFHPEHFTIIVSEVHCVNIAVEAELIDDDEGSLQPTGRYVPIDGEHRNMHVSMRNSELDSVRSSLHYTATASTPAPQKAVSMQLERIFSSLSTMTAGRAASEPAHRSVEFSSLEVDMDVHDGGPLAVDLRKGTCPQLQQPRGTPQASKGFSADSQLLGRREAMPERSSL
eukprot:TRINITY_DN27300_c0_g1_i1.p1 TRINITY_DN27300_c0_g1~~TRINITY_DN27300_c0_g1_i1.p1  ORF type:complete len:418 (-),score=52.68 TRINITY_DN27300_c0_g1_i1:75-1328(-)